MEETKNYIKKILSSNDEKKHEHLVKEICHIMKKLDEEEKEEAERAFYEISEGTVLNEERAGYLISNMKPYGKKWELSDTESVRTNSGYEDIRSVDFWIVMNSAYNDYNDLFKDDVGLYARFSKDFIKDEDAVEDKVYYYFSMIPKE